MRTAGIYLAVAGAVIIVLYVFYEVLRAIVSVPFWMKAGLALVVIGGILLVISLIRERVSDSRTEKFKEIES